MKITCPHCGVKGKVADSLEGRKVGCPKCKEKFVVTADAPPEEIINEAVAEAAVEQPDLPEEAEETTDDSTDAEETEDDVTLQESETSDDEESEEKDEDSPDAEPQENYLASVADESDDDDATGAASITQKCDVCGDKFHPDFLVEIDSHTYCEGCAPDTTEDGMPVIPDVRDKKKGKGMTTLLIFLLAGLAAGGAVIYFLPQIKPMLGL